MATTNCWLLQAVTNLHAGSGDTDYGIIDKQVQRDSVTNLPVINASSIKGAFREALDQQISPSDLTYIFGSDNRKGQNNNLSQGKYRFFAAKLLALPVRASQHFYYVATCPEIIQEFLNDAELLGFQLTAEWKVQLETLAALQVPQGSPYAYGPAADSLRLEDWHAQAQAGSSGLEVILGERVAILHAADFKTLSDELPVIARNHLENGISTNLWYEQVVPREARFYFPVYGLDDRMGTAIKDKLKYHLQVGANATVGYGLCKLSKISA